MGQTVADADGGRVMPWFGAVAAYFLHRNQKRNIMIRKEHQAEQIDNYLQPDSPVIPAEPTSMASAEERIAHTRQNEESNLADSQMDV